MIRSYVNNKFHCDTDFKRHIEFNTDENEAVKNGLTVLQWHALYKGPRLCNFHNFTDDLWSFFY